MTGSSPLPKCTILNVYAQNEKSGSQIYKANVDRTKGNAQPSGTDWRLEYVQPKQMRHRDR